MTCLNTRLISMDIPDSKLKNKFLQASTKIANLIIAIVGISILLYSIWVFLICFWDYRECLFSSWFLWSCIGVGSIFCFTACIGYEAAATRSGHLLSCDFPMDPTDSFDDFIDYVESNSHIFLLLSFFFLFSQMVSIWNGLHLSKTLQIRKILNGRSPRKCKRFEEKKTLSEQLKPLFQFCWAIVPVQMRNWYKNSMKDSRK